LDPPREPSRWGIVETTLLLLWLLAGGFAVHQHVPWADEEQAWLLANGVSWSALFLHSLHYEGTGGLWHAFLKIFGDLGLPFAAARWATLLVEAAGMAVLLRWSPLPRLVRWLLPFTFFLLYQDGVVARSYCLFAVLAFGAAAVLRHGALSNEAQPNAPRGDAIAVPNRKPHVVLLALVLGLMANISLHGALASGALALTAAVRWRRQFLRNLTAMAVLLALWAAAVGTMAPAKDIDFPAGQNIDRSVAKLEKRMGWKVVVPPQAAEAALAGLPPVPVPVHHRTALGSTVTKLKRFLSVITFPLSRWRGLALLLVSCVVLQAVRGDRGCSGRAESQALGALGLLPYGLLVLVFTSMFLGPRHVGMIFTAFVVTLWLTWPGYPMGSIPDKTDQLLGRITAGLLVFTCATQILWTGHALLAEHGGPYGPGQMTARFLQSQNAGTSAQHAVAGYYYGSIDPLLYFDRNLYINQPPHRYWQWSMSMRDYGALGTVQKVLAVGPQWIVLGGYDAGPDDEVTADWEPVTPPVPGVLTHDSFEIAPFFLAHGYRVARVFCGHSWMRDRYAEQLCDTVLERVKNS
jgi:hypothetical protein